MSATRNNEHYIDIKRSFTITRLVPADPGLSADDELDYLRRQVLTSRNIRGGRWVDFLLGGLNYQIEHHLFPSMPGPNLRRSQHLIRQFCNQHGVSYSEAGLFGSYRQVLRHLREVGRPLRPLTRE